jgi:hypothetical protein
MFEKCPGRGGVRTREEVLLKSSPSCRITDLEGVFHKRIDLPARNQSSDAWGQFRFSFYHPRPRMRADVCTPKRRGFDAATGFEIDQRTTSEMLARRFGTISVPSSVRSRESKPNRSKQRTKFRICKCEMAHGITPSSGQRHKSNVGNY